MKKAAELGKIKYLINFQKCTYASQSLLKGFLESGDTCILPIKKKHSLTVDKILLKIFIYSLQKKKTKLQDIR